MAAEDLSNAPPAVQDAAAYLAQHKTMRRMTSIGTLGVILAGLASTGLLHDLAGWSELASAVPLLTALVIVVAVVAWVTWGPLKHVAANESMLARYRALQQMGLPLSATPDAQAEDTSAVARLCARINALTEDPNIRTVTAAAKGRAEALHTELMHLDEMLTTQPELAESLTGVHERVEGEIARIRARLAETYAALIETGSNQDGSTAALEDALHRLRADNEVETPDRPPPQRRAIPTG